MEKQRKENFKYAFDIDTIPSNVTISSSGNRAPQETKDWEHRSFRFFYKILDTPCQLIHDKIEQLRGKRPIYYHKTFKRVPTVDECYTDDFVCIYEANQQLERDMKVDKKILKLLQDRLGHCVSYHGHDDAILCEKIRESANEAGYNFELKYGELGSKTRAQDCYMKQKHRYIMERRKQSGSEKKADE